MSDRELKLYVWNRTLDLKPSTKFLCSHSIPHQTNGIFILSVSFFGQKILSHSLIWVIFDICLSLRTHIQFINIFYQLITSVSQALEIYLASRPLLSIFIAVSFPFLLNYLNCSKLSFCFYFCIYTVYSLKSNRIILLKYHIMTLLYSKSNTSPHSTQSKSSNTYHPIKIYIFWPCCCSDTISYHSPYCSFSSSYWFLCYSSTYQVHLK